jgi:hypothetical protein
LYAASISFLALVYCGFVMLSASAAAPKESAIAVASTVISRVLHFVSSVVFWRVLPSEICSFRVFPVSP